MNVKHYCKFFGGSMDGKSVGIETSFGFLPLMYKIMATGEVYILQSDMSHEYKLSDVTPKE